MSEQYLHGVELLEVTTGARPIKTVKSSVVGIIGTSDSVDYPQNQPFIFTGKPSEFEKLGVTGTLYGALKAIYQQADALCVVISLPTNLNNLDAAIQGDSASAEYTGIEAFRSAASKLGYSPKILLAPGFSSNLVTANKLISVADRIRATALIDGPDTDDAAAIAFRSSFDAKRGYLIDPGSFYTYGGASTLVASSAFVAGAMVKTDNEKGFWHSPSNTVLSGIDKLSRPVDFALSDPNCRANQLNEQHVATIVRENGFRLWGNRTLATDLKWAFLSVVRTADMINESILKAHLWAVDRNITKTYLEDVAESVNNYLRTLTALGAILGGECWPDPELNSTANLQQGKVYFNFKFTPTYPGEHLIFRSELSSDGLEELVAL